MGLHKFTGWSFGGMLLLLLITRSSLSALGGQEPTNQLGNDFVNWETVKQALAVYGSRPTKENGWNLLGVIPKPPVACQYGNREAAGLAILESSALNKEVVAGDPVLAEAAFRLLGYMGGGAVDEELRIMLGRFLVTDPDEFLRLLKRYEYLFASEREYPVNMTEIQEIVPDVSTEDDLRRLNGEEVRLYMKRIRALETVKDSELMQVRDACLRVIKGLIKRGPLLSCFC